MDETPTGHRESVDSLGFSPDGRLVASAGDDGFVALWDARSRCCVSRWKAYSGGANAVAFSPDGTRLATGTGVGSTLRLWDLRTRCELHSLPAPGILFDHVEYQSDGDALLAGMHNGYSYFWRALSAGQAAAWQEEDQAVVDHFSWLQRERGAEAERQRIARGRDEGAIKRWLLLGPIAFTTNTTAAQALESGQVPDEGQLRPKAGEKTATTSGELGWMEVVQDDYVLDFNIILGRLTPTSARLPDRSRRVPR